MLEKPISADSHITEPPNWPNPQSALEIQAKGLTEHERNRICHDNVAELYGLSVN